MMTEMTVTYLKECGHDDEMTVTYQRECGHDDQIDDCALPEGMRSRRSDR